MPLHADGRHDGGFRGRTRRAAIGPDQSLVSTRELDTPLPLIVEPRTRGISLVEWGRTQRGWVASHVARHGGVLLRGFEITTAEELSAFVESITQRPIAYHERSSPRREVSDRIYTSTEHPKEEPIFLHNEQSYNLRFPRTIAFFCREPAAEGGATPIADCRRVLARIPHGIRLEFERRSGYAYVRTLGTGYGLGWQEAFQSDSRATVQAYCDANGIEWEWLDGGLLRTRQVRQVVARHPITGELTWCNHLTFFHVSTLPAGTRALLEASVPPDRLPHQTTYGDGAPMPDAILESLRAAYRAETIRFAWEAGDVLVLDNMLTAHGRDPFEGRRQVLVAMADPTPWTDLTPSQEEHA